MKRAISSFVVVTFVIVTAAFVLLVAEHAFAQDKTPVKVKSSVVVNGVVVVHVLKDGKPLDLQCNQGATTCKALPSGSYLMLQLPENHGMYDCKNVEMYRGDQDKPEDEALGAYCLVEN
jgi:hypothetical protein